MESDLLSNLVEYSVSELSGSIKRTMETAFDRVRLRGEISGYRGPHSSGHAYFSMKDDRSRIDAVIWKGTFAKLKFRPEEGMEVIATGKITTFPGSSKYQIVIETMEPAGVGALMALLEERKRRFEAEGLFDAQRKCRLPFMPKVIGVVTSPTGAVIRDILHRIADRFPVHVIVWPVKVQGEGSGDEIANAIRGFNQLPEDQFIRPDLLIVARGGGSLEDLWSFNDEQVVRAAADSAIPLISAVGHETDWTLLDYAADMRAPTPTGAAEMAVPVKAELEATMATFAVRLQGSSRRQMDHRRQKIEMLMRAFPSLDQILALPRRRFDEANAGLGRGLNFNTLNKRSRFERSAAQVRPATLQAKLVDRRQKLDQQIIRAERAMDKKLERVHKPLSRAQAIFETLPMRLKSQVERLRERLTHSIGRQDTAITHRLIRLRGEIMTHNRVLESLSYKNVLKRGYAVIRDADNKAVAQAAMLKTGTAISIEFSDGEVNAVTCKPAATQASSGKRSPKPVVEKTAKQGDLF